MKQYERDELFSLQQKFREFYAENLSWDYVRLEEQRKPYLRSFIKRSAFFAGFLGLSVYFNNSATVRGRFENSDLFSFIFFLIVIFLLGHAYAPIQDYKEKTKKRVMKKILSFFGRVQYDGYYSEHSEDMMKNSGLFGVFNREEFDDCFSGVYNGVKVNVSEVELENDTGSGKSRRIIRKFKGILISLDMKKKFSGQTIVRRKGAAWGDVFGVGWMSYFYMLLCVFLGVLLLVAMGLPVLMYRNDVLLSDPKFFWTSIGYGAFFWGFSLFSLFKFLRKRRIAKKMQDVQLEDVVFDKNWNVRSSDQIEARYVLTPALMERMLEIKKRFRGRKIEFSFWDNKVLIAVHTNKDMFETTSLFSSALKYRKVQEVIAQFYSVFSAVDLFKTEAKEEEKR